jgi:beta-glucosidase
MMKRSLKNCSILMSALMLGSAIGVPAMAEEGPTEAELLAQACNFAMIEADEATGQERLTYIEGVTPIIEADGLKFKDMNKNGALDPYEDWRLDDATRAQDIISQMNDKEKAGNLFCVSANLQTARSLIPDFNLGSMLFNLNGSPVEVVNTLNNLQAKAEEERLGIPLIFTSDREYNAFGGYIDKAHIAYGTANDPELAYQLSYIYGQAMVATGIHVTFEPYANEIGAQYGENPEHIAAIVYQEVKGMEDSGFASCVKHWIGRGGDSNFGNARSVAQNFDNWMVGWKAALAGGNEWVMTNCGGTGITNTTDVKWDTVTMSYLRDTLGFQGIVVTDWWALGMGRQVSGVTNEGVELSEQTGAWLYGQALKNGTDMFGAGSIYHGTKISGIENEDGTKTGSTMSNWPDCIIEGLKTGEVEQQYVDRSLTRIMEFRFRKNIFDNPYRVPEEALAVVASPEYQAEQWPLDTNEALRKARRADEVELAERLQAESAVLMKNDGGVLPLAAGTKVYFESYNSETKDHFVQYLNEHGTVVENMEDADVVLGWFTNIDDAAELMIEDAKDAGKPVIVTMTNKASEYELVAADALIYMPYSQQPDHGSGTAGFIYTTEPWVYADLVFGTVQPGGIIQKEQARNAFTEAAQWKDLAGDQGASNYVRLIVQALMEDDENHASPNNYGDPLVVYNYSMKYGEAGDFKYSCLILPTTYAEQETTNSRGQTVKSVVGTVGAKAGEEFNVYCLLRNNGADDLTMVQVKANDEVVAEKLYTVCGGSWRVVEIPVTLEAGEYTIDVGGQTASLTVAE